jgi:hypothetical protein
VTAAAAGLELLVAEVEARDGGVGRPEAQEQVVALNFC